MRVANPPAKLTVLWDAGCLFCARWIERWRERTGDAVDYRPSQEASAEFSHLLAERFERSVVLIEPDGRVRTGAAAVFYSLGRAPRAKWLTWSYEHAPGFAWITEATYRLIARNRHIASRMTRLLWGDDVRRPTYFAARRWFLQTLGLVYLFGFISVWVQVDGLMGEKGLLPAGEMLSMIGRSQSHTVTPTLCWLSTSSAMLHGLCAAGTLASLALAFGIVPLPALLVCYVSYLSLVPAGELFFSYQWDILLLETGILALFIAPLQLRLTTNKDNAVSSVGWLLLRLLLFKLMFMSGFVKLTSGDNSWLSLTALDYHYWTQPLPTVFAWFADKNPEWLKKISVAATLVIEIAVPFFIWAPRRLRQIAAVLLIALQIAIAFTGNYNFFNLLTAALCIPLIDDSVWSRVRITPQRHARFAPIAATAILALTLPLNVWLIYSSIEPDAEWPQPIASLYRIVAPFNAANSYGLFRVMTKERPEIVFEGRAEGGEWRPYEFRYKPGDLRRPPQWNAPHQPRLDWAMWFAALGSGRDRIIAARLAQRLLENEPAVLSLLGRNPFRDSAPRYIRANLYDYHFTSAEERKQTGKWWKREWRSEFLPAVSLDDFAGR